MKYIFELGLRIISPFLCVTPPPPVNNFAAPPKTSPKYFVTVLFQPSPLVDSLCVATCTHTFIMFMCTVLLSAPLSACDVLPCNFQNKI